MKTVYTYHPTTGQLIGATALTDADLSPLEPGVYLIPGAATEAPPPATGPSERAVWVDGAWVVQQEPATVLPPEPVPLTPDQLAAQIIAEVTAATQARLDDFARTRNYDGILSACTYSASAIAKFGIEGQYAVNARDATWATLYELMADVQAGARPMPTGFADVEPDLPVLEWPL